MSAAPSTRQPRGSRVGVWTTIAAGILLLVAANVRLVYDATMSEPDCVAHLRAGDAAVAQGAFRAANSSCSPRHQSAAAAQAE